MRYPASDKAEIIRLVEHSHLPVRRTLEMLGIPRATFYRWYDRFQTGGPRRSATPRPGPAASGTASRGVRSQIIALALEEPELSPRELAVRFTDERGTSSRKPRSPACSRQRPPHQPSLSGWERSLALAMT
jgi:transposase-like protein